MARFFINAGIIPPPGAEDAATTAWVAAVVANGGTVSTGRRTVVNSLIAGLKADGLFTKLDRLWLHAGENQPSALTDIIANALATAVNSPTFTTDMGYSGFNTTIYINSNYIPASSGNMTLNSAHLSSWAISAGAPGGSAPNPAGVLDTAAVAYLQMEGNSANPPVMLTRNNTNGFTNTQTFSAGLLTTIRPNSTQQLLYFNGSLQFTDSVNSVGIPAKNLFIGSRNDDGTVNAVCYWNGQLAATSVGVALTGTDVSNFYSRLNTYMSAVGVSDSDANVAAWMTKVRSNGGTVSLARRDLVHNLVAGLKIDGVWSKLDRLWLFAAADQASALVDLVATTVATNVASTTFTTDRGFTGGGAGSGMYIDSNSNPTVIAGNYLQDSACHFGWNNTAGTADTTALLGGLTASVSYSSLSPYSAGFYSYGINVSSPFGGLTASSGATGLYLMNRASSTTETLDLNGSQVETHSNTSLGQQNTALKALWDGNLILSTRQISCMGFGGSLTGTDRSNLYLRLRTYMTGVGVP